MFGSRVQSPVYPGDVRMQVCGSKRRETPVFIFSLPKNKPIAETLLNLKHFENKARSFMKQTNKNTVKHKRQE